MKKKTNTALLLIVVIGIAILIGSLAMMLPDVEDAPEDTDRTPTVTTDTAAPGDPEDPSEPEDTVKNGYTISVQNTNSSWVYADGIETDDAYLYGKRVIEFVQDAGYRHPDKVLVIGASSTWYKGTGYLEIYNATSDVTVIYEPVQTFKVILNATNCNIASDVKIVDWAGTASFTVKPNAGYKLDHIENMSWTGSCTKFAYDNDSGVLTVGGIVSDLTITVTPVVQTYSVTFVGEEYFTVYQYQATGTDEGNYTFADGEYHSWILAPISGYKISNVEFQGIKPDICMLETNIDGANVGAMFQIGGNDPTSYDIKIIVTVEKLPPEEGGTFLLTTYSYDDRVTFDVSSIEFSPGDSVQILALFNGCEYDYDQLLTIEGSVSEGYSYAECHYGAGYAFIEIYFHDDFADYLYPGMEEIVFSLSTIESSQGSVAVDANCNGGGSPGGPSSTYVNPGQSVLLSWTYDEGYSWIDFWSCDVNSDFWTANVININGKDYILLYLTDDFPTDSYSFITFTWWCA